MYSSRLLRATALFEVDKPRGHVRQVGFLSVRSVQVTVYFHLFSSGPSVGIVENMFRRATSRVVHPQGMAIYSHLRCKELGGGIRLISAVQYNTRRWFRWYLLRRDMISYHSLASSAILSNRREEAQRKILYTGASRSELDQQHNVPTERQGRRYVQNTREHPKLHAALKVQPSKRAQKADALGINSKAKQRGGQTTAVYDPKE